MTDSYSKLSKITDTTADEESKETDILNPRHKKQHTDDITGKNKCTFTRLNGMVTHFCACLDDKDHMSLLKLPERRENAAQKSKCTSLTPGWESYIHSMCENTNEVSGDLESGKISEVIPVDRDQKIFCTGSNYVGQWNVLGMKGFGTYIMPHGVEYCGEFEDGQFHGNGTLTYPNGLKLGGVFEDGKMIKWDLQFADGLQYNVPWNYCKMPDRRFYPEIMDSIPPAGCSLITPDDLPREIPKGCYDTGDGYFDPNMKCIYSAHKPNKILRVASKLEEEWILANCRGQEDRTTQYRPDLYAKLITGCDEYSLERKNSSQTLDSDNFTANNDIVERNYMIADLMDIPPIKSELSRKQFGRNVVETTLHDIRRLPKDGTWIKTYGHQQMSSVEQTSMVSKPHKSVSGTIEQDVKQGVQDTKSGVSMVIAPPPRMKKDSLKTLSLVELHVTTPSGDRKPFTMMSSKGAVSTHHGVRVDTTDIDGEIPDSTQIKEDLDDRIPHGGISDKKKLTTTSDKGSINIEITSKPGEGVKQVTNAIVNMKKETPTHKEIAGISMGSYISTETSRANTNINMATDTCSSVLFIETENKSDEVITIDIQSISHVEPTQKTSTETLEKPLTFQSHFEDTIRSSNTNDLVITHRSSGSLSNSWNEFLNSRNMESSPDSLYLQTFDEHLDDDDDDLDHLTLSPSGSSIDLRILLDYTNDEADIKDIDYIMDSSPEELE